MNVNPKVTAAVLAAAVTTIIAWLLKTAGVELPNEVQGAITTILVFVAGYLTSANGPAPVVNVYSTADPEATTREIAERTGPEHRA